MKLACTSSAFEREFATGDLTQLEWLDLCARELAADGVVLDTQHFPRTDDDYLAQVRKMAVDLGLTVAAIAPHEFFSASSSLEEPFRLAEATGAPLLVTALPMQTERGWTEMLERLSAAASLAKRRNITLAIRNASGSLAATTADLIRVAKEADSAWVRFAPDFAAFDAGSEPARILERCVIAWHRWDAQRHVVSDEDTAMERILETLVAFRGFLVLESAARGAIMKFRTMLATEVMAESL